jgi:hypothetical protein
MTTDKKTKTPRNANSILAGALSLTLAERVKIKNELQLSIENELTDKENELKEAREIVTGKQH